MLERTARVCAAAVALSAGLACASADQMERYRAQRREIARPEVAAATAGQGARRNVIDVNLSACAAAWRRRLKTTNSLY